MEKRGSEMKKPCTLDTIKLFFLALSPSVYQGLNQTQQPWPQLSWSHSSNSQLYPTSPQHGEDLSTHSRSPRGDPHDDPLGRAGEPPPRAPARSGERSSSPDEYACASQYARPPPWRWLPALGAGSDPHQLPSSQWVLTRCPTDTYCLLLEQVTRPWTSVAEPGGEPKCHSGTFPLRSTSSPDSVNWTCKMSSISKKPCSPNRSTASRAFCMSSFGILMPLQHIHTAPLPQSTFFPPLFRKEKIIWQTGIAWPMLWITSRLSSVKILWQIGICCQSEKCVLPLRRPPHLLLPGWSHHLCAANKLNSASLSRWPGCVKKWRCYLLNERIGYPNEKLEQHRHSSCIKACVTCTHIGPISRNSRHSKAGMGRCMAPPREPRRDVVILQHF